MNTHQNIKYYSLCRYKKIKHNRGVGEVVDIIYAEITALFDNFYNPARSTIQKWIKQYEVNKKMPKFDETNKFGFHSLKFTIDSQMTNLIQKMQFYTLCRHQLNAPFAEIETDLQWLFNTLTPGTVSIKLWIDTRWTGDVSINQTQNTTEYTQLEQDFEMDQSVEMEVVDVEQNVLANETKQDIKQVIPFVMNIKSEKVEPDIKTDFKTNIPLDLNPNKKRVN